MRIFQYAREVTNLGSANIQKLQIGKLANFGEVVEGGPTKVKIFQSRFLNGIQRRASTFGKI